MPSSVLAPIELSAADRAQLESWTRRRTSAQALALRSRIVLLAAEGRNNTEIAGELGIHRNVAGKWRSRFVEHGLDGLTDEPRPGRPRTISDDQVEEVVVKTLETTPKDATHWSTRSMAREVGLTQSAVLRIWKAFGLQPHRQDTWKLSRDPLFIDKVRDVVGLYLNPPERAVVLCVDEKSQIQALDRTAPILPMLPGTPQRATHDYKRAGTSSLYAALDITTGKVIGALHSRHRAIEFKKFLQAIDREVPDELAVHLVLDNSSTHKTPAIQRWLAAHPRFVLHFTPTSSSWLNLVERWFAELTTKQLRRGAHRSVRQLNADIRAWIEAWNDEPRPFVWTKTAEQILDSIARYCQRINESRHEPAGSNFWFPCISAAEFGLLLSSIPAATWRSAMHPQTAPSSGAEVSACAPARRPNQAPQAAPAKRSESHESDTARLHAKR
jgi:transposase